MTPTKREHIDLGVETTQHELLGTFGKRAGCDEDPFGGNSEGDSPCSAGIRKQGTLVMAATRR
jgi:hypothetical protein